MPFEVSSTTRPAGTVMRRWRSSSGATFRTTVRCTGFHEARTAALCLVYIPYSFIAPVFGFDGTGAAMSWISFGDGLGNFVVGEVLNRLTMFDRPQSRQSPRAHGGHGFSIWPAAPGVTRTPVDEHDLASERYVRGGGGWLPESWRPPYWGNRPLARHQLRDSQQARKAPPGSRLG